MLSRYANHMARESTYKISLRIYDLTCLERKRKEIQDELQQNDTDDDDIDILFQASSSGVVRTPRSRSVSRSRRSSVASDNT
jgi:hypothetical protein